MSDNEDEMISLFFNGSILSLEPVQYSGQNHTIQGCPPSFGGTQHIMFCNICNKSYTYCDEHFRDYFASHLCISCE